MVSTVAQLPPEALPLIVLLSAMLEHVVPPYWGDLTILVGFVLAARGAGSLGVLFLCAVVGSVLGAAVAYELGRRYGVAIVPHLRFRRNSRYGDREVRQLFRHFGDRLLLANRFIPVVRSVVLYGAGALGRRRGRVLWLSGVSSTLWVALLLGVGALTLGTWDQIEARFRQWSHLGAVAALVLVLVGLAFSVWRTKVGRRPDPGLQSLR